MKKKVLSLMLCAAMTISLLAGCGSSSSGSSNSGSANSGSANSGSTAAQEKVLNFGLEAFSDGLIIP